MQEKKQDNHFNWKDLRYFPIFGWAVVFIIWLIEKCQHKKQTDVPINFIQIEDKPKHSPQTKQTNPKYIFTKPQHLISKLIQQIYNKHKDINKNTDNIQNITKSMDKPIYNIIKNKQLNNKYADNNNNKNINTENKNEFSNKKKTTKTTDTAETYNTIKQPNVKNSKTTKNNTNSEKNEKNQEENKKNDNQEKIQQIENEVETQQIPEFSKRKNLPYLYDSTNNFGAFLSAFTLLYNNDKTYKYIMETNKTDELLKKFKVLFLLLNAKSNKTANFYLYINHAIAQHKQLATNIKKGTTATCQYLFEKANVKFQPENIIKIKKLENKPKVCKLQLQGDKTKKIKDLLKKNSFIINIYDGSQKKQSKSKPIIKTISLMRDVVKPDTWIINFQTAKENAQQVYIKESCLEYFLIYPDAMFANYLLDFFQTDDIDDYEYCAESHDKKDYFKVLTLYKNIDRCRSDPNKINEIKYTKLKGVKPIKNLNVKTNLFYSYNQQKTK